MNTFFNELTQKIEKSSTEQTQDVKSNIEALKKKGDELYEEHEKKSKDTLDFLEEKRKEAAQLINIIGNIGFTGNYNKIANQERKAANILRVIAIIFMVVGVIIVGTIVFNVSKAGFDWKVVLSRIAVTITILIPAFYSARESDRHRQRENRNRKMELELASIGPYLELLPEDKKIELKAQLTEKLFGQPEVETGKGDTITATSLFGLVEKIVNNLTKK